MIEDTQEHRISPKYIMTLVPKIEEALWGLFDTSRYRNVRYYIQKWHEEDDYNWENFHIFEKEGGNIDLTATLHDMSEGLLIKVAIDLGVDTPGFLPCIPTFKNILKDSNENAFQTFERATKNVLDNPDEAVSLANSALEGIIKTILSDESFAEVKYNSKATLYDLTNTILKQFKLFPKKNQEIAEINVIGSSLLAASKAIEDLRSTKTKAHGKIKDDYIIDDPLWAHFIVNAVATIGLFLLQFFETKYKPARIIKDDEKPIDLSEIPF